MRKCFIRCFLALLNVVLAVTITTCSNWWSSDELNLSAGFTTKLTIVWTIITHLYIHTCNNWRSLRQKVTDVIATKQHLLHKFGGQLAINVSAVIPTISYLRLKP